MTAGPPLRIAFVTTGSLNLRWLVAIAAALVGCQYDSFVMPSLLPTAYTIHELGLLPGGTQSQANSGTRSTIVGWGIVAGTAHHAVTFSGGAAHALTEPAGSANSEARGVNDAGTIVGFATIGGVRQAVVWPSASAAPVLLQSLGGAYSFARSINQTGVVLGSAQTAAGDTVIVTWTPTIEGDDEGPERLDPTGGQDYDATAINNRGLVAGNSDEGFIWSEDEGFDDVEAPEGGDDIDVNGMNNLGVVVGGYTDASGADRALLFTGAAGSLPLGEPPSGYAGVGGNAVSDSGIVSATATGVDGTGAAISVGVVGTIVDTAHTWTLLPTLGGTRGAPQDHAITACGVVLGWANKPASAAVRYAVAWVPNGCTIP